MFKIQIIGLSYFWSFFSIGLTFGTSVCYNTTNERYFSIHEIFSNEF